MYSGAICVGQWPRESPILVEAEKASLCTARPADPEEDVAVGKGKINQRVSNAALVNAALVLSSKNWKNIQDGGQRRKTNPKSLGLSAAVRE